MAKIYSKAHRIIVWLGEETIDTEGVLDEIGHIANEESTDHSKEKINYRAILALFQRTVTYLDGFVSKVEKTLWKIERKG